MSLATLHLFKLGPINLANSLYAHRFLSYRDDYAHDLISFRANDSPMEQGPFALMQVIKDEGRV